MQGPTCECRLKFNQRVYVRYLFKIKPERVRRYARSSRDWHNRFGMITSPADLIASVQDVLELIVDRDNEHQENATSSSFAEESRMAFYDTAELACVVTAVVKRAARTLADAAAQIDDSDDQNTEWNVRSSSAVMEVLGLSVWRLNDGVMYARKRNERQT